MSGKQSDKEESTLTKVKQLFGIKQSKIGVGVGTVKLITQEYILAPELVKDIGSSSPTPLRLKTLKELSEVVQTKILEENGIEVIWESIKDLLKLSITDERQFVLKFLCNLIKGQYGHLGIMRAQFFHVIQNEVKAFEDLRYRLELLQVLSCNGKELEYFEEEMGLLLRDLMKDVMSSKVKSDFYQLLINTVRFNAAYLDEDVITSFVVNTCVIASNITSDEEIELCLRLLETMVSFCYLPSGSLNHVLVCLCCVINRPSCTQSAWQLMRKLLGTHLGHSAIYQMCCLLKETMICRSTGENIQRGAVYFIGMALWGANKVPSLKHPASAILPSFLEVLTSSGSDIITYEIVGCVSRLVTKHNYELSLDAWDLVLDIVEAALRHRERNANCPSDLVKAVQDLLSSLENLYEQGQFYSSADRLFAILESCVSKLPEASVVCLINYRTKNLTPFHGNWLSNLSQLIDVYFRKESRPSTRKKVLEVLHGIINSYKDLYQVELIQTVVLPHFENIDALSESDVKQQAVEIILDLATLSHSDQFYDLLEIIGKVLHRPLLVHQSVSVAARSPEGVADKSQKFTICSEVEVAVSGLIRIFRKKLFEPESNHAIRAYGLMTSYLSDLMKSTNLASHTGHLKRSIFDCLLDLRADENCRVGLCNVGKENSTVFSRYVFCGRRCQEIGKLSVTGTTQVDCDSRPLLLFDDAYLLLCQSIENEKDWKVLSVILERLPLLLQNKTILSCVSSGGIERLTGRLCRMLSDKTLPEHFFNCLKLVNKSDFHAYIFPVLTCLVSFHSHLDKSRQVELVRCLEFGLVSKCSQACIRGLTVCALEMQNTMMRQLPSVLLKLSQICATVSMAVPLMEFLSSLIHLPQLYSNFVEEQYKSVFAIALPYTNPFKYSHYTVSLAYHVIATWFTKCRLPFRRGFVPYIIKGLKSNVLRQIEESETYLMRVNQDSSDRNRTQSLNEEALRNDNASDGSRKASLMMAKVKGAREGSVVVTVDQPSTTTATTPSIAAVPDQSVASNFHKELRDTCVDMLSRYAYFTSSSIPKRSHVAEFLLSGGQSQSWLVGTSIVTITTSGGSKVGKSGLCEKCFSIARTSQSQASSLDLEAEGDEGYRRRHKSAAVATMKEDVGMLPLISQDDMLLNRRQARQAATEGSATSLASSAQKIQAVDNVLMGLKPKPLEKSVFTAHMCNCWCTQWAEVHVRRATGNFSWMMRIQNEQDLVAMFPDFILSDISNLFKPVAEEPPEPRKIDSSSLEEKDYVQMLDEFFHPPFITSSEKTVVDESSQNPEDHSVLRSHSSPDLKREQLALSILPTEPTTESGNEDRTDNLPIVGSPKPIITRSQSLSAADIEKRRSSPDDRTPGSGESKSAHETTHSKREQRPRSGVLSSVSEESDQITSVSHRHSVHIFADMKPGLLESKTKSSDEIQPLIATKDAAIHGGISPTFLFLQLFHSQCFGITEDSVIPMPMNEMNTQSLKLLDMIYPYETHKIGVIYIKPGQTKNELAILSNMFGSTRYMAFLENLGHLLRLSDCNSLTTYLGGLDTKGTDGQFAYAWHADFMQVIFHVVTLMPYIDHDKQFTEKKKHIGNDFVTIVYNDSGEDYRMGIIKGQFNYVNIIIKPLDHGTNEVTVQTKQEIEDMIAHKDTKIISDANLGLLVRQMAVHANLASTIYVRQKVHPLNPYASNWLERLRRIKAIRERLIQERSKLDHEAKLSDDFSIFTQ